MADRRIICIHGLASKPPEAKLAENWKKCLTENILALCQDGELRREDVEGAVEMVYWADEVPDHLPDERDYCDKLDKKIGEVIGIRRKEGDRFHVPKLGARIKGRTKTRLANSVSLLTRALTVKDDVVEKKAHEVRLYRNDQYIAGKIRKKVADAIQSAWGDRCRVAILSHSMGTFVAYDVLWELAHRTGGDSAGFVDLFVTMGSPLGDSLVQGFLLGSRYEPGADRYYPTNVLRWHNYSALGDIVCHDSTLMDDFLQPMRSLGLLCSAEDDARDYVDLYNPFKTVNGDDWNPHKSYGYLLQPKLGKWLRAFLVD